MTEHVPTDIDERIWHRLNPFVSEAIARQDDEVREAILAAIEAHRLGFRVDGTDPARFILGVEMPGQGWTDVCSVDTRAAGLHMLPTDDDDTVEPVYLPDPILDS